MSALFCCNTIYRDTLQLPVQGDGDPVKVSSQFDDSHCHYSDQLQRSYNKQNRIPHPSFDGFIPVVKYKRMNFLFCCEVGMPFYRDQNYNVLTKSFSK